MKKAADLEIGLHRRDADSYQIELRFNHPDSDTDDRLGPSTPVKVQFDRDRLQSRMLNAAAYGRLLGESLFESQEIRAEFGTARNVADSLGVALRVKLVIGPSAPELQSLRWETLRDPETDRGLLTDEHILFSRYLRSSDLCPVRLRPRADLRAFVVIANPTDITEYHMAALNVDEELDRAKSGLGKIPVTELASGGRATLENLVTHLRDGYDILYLVGHGMLVDDEPWLWLEDETGKTHQVSGVDLATRLRELQQRPRLVVLASCQSAGTGETATVGDEGALAALGPRLAEAGIPAVIAMQGNITITTIDAFMPVFFQELQRDGQIDRAMAVARGTVRERPDWWMPVLFMRLKNGCLWDPSNSDRTSEPAEARPLREAYLRRLLKNVSQVMLSGIDPQAAGQEGDASLDLSAIYTALLTRSMEPIKRNGSEEYDGSIAHNTSQERRLSALAQLDRYLRLVLLGDPGSGKSTFVNFVTMCLAGAALGDEQTYLNLLTAPLPNDEGENEEKRQAWTHGPLLPVRVILRDFAAKGLPPVGQQATAEHLWTFLARDLKTVLGDYAPYLQKQLTSPTGSALLLLDGLDEVPEAEQRRTQIRQAVEDFAAVFPHCRILVTSRTYAYQQPEWHLSDFAKAELAPFTKGQIRRFVDRWYRHSAVIRGKNIENALGQAELLKRAILTSGRLYSLAERPLLLTLMASLHYWRGGSLPEKREELYDNTVELLLDWWEKPKIIRAKDSRILVAQESLTELLNVRKDPVRKVLERVAFQVHQSQSDLAGTADIAEHELVKELMDVSQNKDLRPTRLIEYLNERAGLLMPRGVKVYTFPHRTFQEYLAACYLTGDEEEYPYNVADLARQDPNRWREVVLLAGAKASRGAASTIWVLVDALCEQPFDIHQTNPENTWGALLAGQVLVETANLKQVRRNQHKLSRIRGWLVAILTEQAPQEAPFPAVERALAGNLLAHLGDLRPGVGLKDGLPDIEWYEVPAGSFLMGSTSKTVNLEKPKWEKLFEEYNADDATRDLILRLIASEQPQHEVFLSAYQISRYPVTNAQYRMFIKDGGYTEKWRECWTPEGWQWREQEDITEPDWAGDKFDVDNHPVVDVSWYEASAFCQWLTQCLRKCGTLSENHLIRLPTEAQWEKAARGMDGQIYPWGNDVITPELANYGDTGLGVTSAVGCFPRGVSRYGCEDMAGNVWEWCLDWFGEDYYSKSPKENPQGPASGSARVLRGGGWGVNAVSCRAASRLNDAPVYRLHDLGFRLVRTPS